MSIVKRLVELHGGTVEARRPASGGAEFVVELPLATGIARGSDDEEKGASEIGRTRCRILVVDDNADAADCLAMILKAEGHEAQAVYDGRTAVERVATFRPHVVLLDLGMPAPDGFETARRLRALPEGAELVIAALTGWGQEKDRRRTAEAGFDFHLVKPVRASELRDVLEEPAARKRRGSEAADAPLLEVLPQQVESKQAIGEDEESHAEREESPFSKIVHDLAGCFFGIRMAAEVLESLPVDDSAQGEKIKRMAASIQGDCRKGGELTTEVRELLAAWEE